MQAHAALPLILLLGNAPITSLIEHLDINTDSDKMLLFIECGSPDSSKTLRRTFFSVVSTPALAALASVLLLQTHPLAPSDIHSLTHSHTNDKSGIDNTKNMKHVGDH